MLYKSIIYIIIVSLSYLLHSCANIVPLSGGAKDTKAPILLKSIPRDGQVNYTNNSIDLYFNENVDADNITESLIISPLIHDNYNTLVKKNKVSIQFNKPFMANTTYNFYFGECIKDITEKNPTNLNLSFSTGPYIDSLYIKGQITDHEKKKPIPNASVALYLYDDTLDIKNNKPLYYTRSNLNGNYQLKNIKAGTYKMYSLIDGNKNFMYDNEKELIAYKDSLSLNKSIEKLNLTLTKLDTKEPKILSDNSGLYYHTINFNEGLISANVIYKKDTLPSILYESNKKLKVFNIIKDVEDSIAYLIIAKDSAGNSLQEEYKILYKKEETKKKTTHLYTYRLEPTNYQLSPYDSIKIYFDGPVDVVNYDSLFIKTDDKKSMLTAKNLTFSNNGLNLLIHNYPTFKDSLILYFNKGAFINTNHDSTSIFKMIFRRKNAESYGTISGTIISEKPYYIFQLLDNNYKIIKTKRNIRYFNYKYLDPGTYQLRVILDDNNNGKYDPLDLKSGKQAEEFIYYKEPINLRANWDIEDIKFIIK